MVADLKTSTYLADGVDLEATGVELTHDGAGLYAGLAEQVSTVTTPGNDGGIIGGGLWTPYTLSTMFIVRAAGFDATWAAIVALRRRCKPGRSVTLTRRMPDPDGTAANTDHTSTARRQNDRVEWLGAFATVDIDWLITDPWHGPATTIASLAGAQSILGDTRTYRMTFTLAAGGPRTVTNTTNGFWFTWGGTAPTGGVLVDVEARTAITVVGGIDYSGYLSWGKSYPMRLDPGSNTFTVSAGTASVSYQPAYL